MDLDENTTVILLDNSSLVVQGASDTIVSIVDTTSTVVKEDSNNIVSITESLSTILANGIQGPQGTPGISEEDNVYSKRVDFISDNELYRGEAAVGSSESSSLWRIRKITIASLDGDVVETWASGTAFFDKVWVDRLTYIYS